MNSPSTRPPSLRPFLALLAVFLVPIAGTALLSYFPNLIPQGRTNHGDLLQPPPMLPESNLLDAQGQALSEPLLRKRWHLLWLSRGQCGQRCETLPDMLKRIQLALGKDADRLSLAILSPTDIPAKAPPSIPVALQAPASLWPSLLATLQAPPTADALYLIDPQGHIVLRYAVEAAAQGILKDIERLLKYSWVG